MTHSLWLIRYDSFAMNHSLWLIRYDSFAMTHALYNRRRRRRLFKVEVSRQTRSRWSIEVSRYPSYQFPSGDKVLLLAISGDSTWCHVQFHFPSTISNSVVLHRIIYIIYITSHYIYYIYYIYYIALYILYILYILHRIIYIIYITYITSHYIYFVKSQNVLNIQISEK